MLTLRKLPSFSVSHGRAFSYAPAGWMPPLPEAPRTTNSGLPYDAVVIGAGFGGLATALRLQAEGMRTCVLEAHFNVGGQSSFWETSGGPQGKFSFDVGATTLVDFTPGGVGGEFLEAVGFRSKTYVDADAGHKRVRWRTDCSSAGFTMTVQPGYSFTNISGDATANTGGAQDHQHVRLWHDDTAWHRERAAKFGTSPEVMSYFELTDRIESVYWPAARRGVRLPVSSFTDMIALAQAFRTRDWATARYLWWSMHDALDSCGVHKHGPHGHQLLHGMLRCLAEDTVHSVSLKDAPLVNAVMGAGIRGVGIARADGGMQSVMRALVQRYTTLGGELWWRTKAVAVEGMSVETGFRVQARSHPRAGDRREHSFSTRRIVSNLGPELTQHLMPHHPVAK